MANPFSDSEIHWLQISQLRGNPYQPRSELEEKELSELAASISQLGVLQPLLVRATNENFELIAGERRLRAAALAGLEQVPVRILSANDLQSASMALAENLAREQLTPYDEAVALYRLQRMLHPEKGLATTTELSRQVGRSIGSVSESLQIARAIDDDILTRAELRRADISRLPKTALLAAARSDTNDGIIALLRLATSTTTPQSAVITASQNSSSRSRRGKRGRPPKPYSLSIPRNGRIELRLRRSVNDFSKEDARDLLSRLNPFVDKLRKRAQGETT